MGNEIFNALLNSGFKEEERGVSTRIYDRKYDVYDDNGIFTIKSYYEAKSEAMKNSHLDAVEKISSRYGITSAGYDGDYLYVILTKATNNIEEEVRRIKFLIQSLNRLTDNEILKEEKKNKAKDLNLGINKEGINLKKENNSDIYRATARQGSVTYGAYGYSKDKDGNKKMETYMSNEALTYEKSKKLVEEQKKNDAILVPIDREEVPAIKGIVGALMGIFISLILLAVLHKFGLIASFLAFIMGIMALIGYRSLSGKKEIYLHHIIIPLIISSIFLSAIMNAIEIQEIIRAQQGVNLSMAASLLKGFAAFFNNRVYYVAKSWEQIAVSILSSLAGLFAAIYFWDNKEKFFSKNKGDKNFDDDGDIGEN